MSGISFVRCFRVALALITFLGYGGAAVAQLVPYTPIAGEEDDPLRLLIRDGGRAGVHAGLQPPTFSDVAALVDTSAALGAPDNWVAAATLRRARVRLGTEVAHDRDLYRGGLGGWLRRSFYRTRGYALDVGEGGFRFRANPVLDLRTGRQTNGGGYNFVNTRGVRLMGTVDDRVHFQTAIYENQRGLVSYAREWRQAYGDQVPGAGFYKDYDPILYDLDGAVDFLQATGEVGFRLTRHIHARLGHGNPQVGIGERSVILGAFADPFLYAQIDTRLGRFHYRNLYTQLQDGRQTAQRVERKYLVAHTLSFQLTDAWEVGLTEQTVFKRDGGFDAQYLNPVIFYRAVEQDNGSPDNALIAFHTNVILAKTAVVYGQFLFDELKFDELFVNGDKWWANKWSLQLGGRYLDAFGATGLNLLAEVNAVRPFTYAHRFEGIGFTHYNQPLAHPWGASLSEVIVGAEQWVTPRLRLRARLTRLSQDDILLPPAPHIGANVLYDNDLRGHLAGDEGPDYGYEIAGETAARRTLATAEVQFLPFPGATLDARYEYYARTPDGAEAVVQHGFRLGLTLNAWQRRGLF